LVIQISLVKYDTINCVLFLKRCKAIDSCLWEIKTLKNHYSPKVVALVRNFTDENAPKYEIDMEPYIKENFNSLYEEVPFICLLT